MSDRRSHQRYAVAAPWIAAIRTVRDVTIERTGADEVTAVTHQPAVVGEGMWLELMAHGATVTRDVRVLESRSVVAHETVRHRLRLRLTDTPARSGAEARGAEDADVKRLPIALFAPRGGARRPADTLDRMLQAPDVVAALRREVPVEVMDVSVTGCLVAAAGQLAVGDTGVMEVAVGKGRYSEAVRVVRCRPRDGGHGRYLAGAEILWITAPHAGTLRRIVARLRAGAIKDGSIV